MFAGKLLAAAAVQLRPERRILIWIRAAIQARIGLLAHHSGRSTRHCGTPVTSYCV
jgi:hypothetical protein